MGQETRVKLELRLLSIATLASTIAFATGCPSDDDGDGNATESPTSGSTPGETDPTDTTVTATGVVGEPKADGENCTTDAECISERCFVIIGLGGLCGECTTDADCDGGGCSLPNPLVSPAQGSTCNTGGLGEGCETAEICADASHVCATVIDADPLIVSKTCSECETSADCAKDTYCNTSIDIANISGQKTCVPLGSVADGEFCDPTADGDGDLACANHCSVTTVMGIADVGVCGPCRGTGAESEGCLEGEVCVEPSVDIDATIVPSACVAE